MSVQQALQFAHGSLTIAFLDIELPDGKSYPIARKLIEQGLPVVFVSGNDSRSLPEDLRNVSFLPKPVIAPRLVGLAKALLGKG